MNISFNGRISKVFFLASLLFSGAAWADIKYFGITGDANTDVATEFVTYSMKDGYTATLSIAPEAKFPVRRGEPLNTSNM